MVGLTPKENYIWTPYREVHILGIPVYGITSIIKNELTQR